MAIIGSAQVLIRPTFSNMQREIRREIEQMGDQVGSESGRRAGSSLGSSLAKWGKRGAVVAGGAIAAVTGTALVKGFGRLQAIENAQAKLRGLGHDADSVRVIMDNALASVKGTAFGLGEAATVAASAVAAGIQPGEALTGHLSNVANMAAAAGTSMEEMGGIFNKAATQVNGVQNDVISRLADRGIPIYQALADQMGVTAGEVFKLASEGKVDFETFSAAAEAAAGTVADEMGTTLGGAFQNTLAALGRVGANLMSRVYPYFSEFFLSAIEFLGPLEEKAAEVGEAVGRWMERGAEAVKTFIQEFRDGEGPGGRFREVVERVGDVVRTAFTFIKNSAIPALMSFGQWLVRIRGWLIPIAAGILTIAAAWKTYQTVMAIVRGVTVAFTAVQAALNVVLAMNPIGLVVMALVGLAAAIAVAWNRSETFRNVVTGVFGAVAAAGRWLWESVLKPVWGALSAAWDAVASGISHAWENWIKPAWNALVEGVQWLWGIVSPIFTAIWTVWSTVGQWVYSVYFNVIKLVWDLLVAYAKYMWATVLKPTFSAISTAFEAIGTGVRWVWNNLLKPAWDAISTAAKWLWDNGLKPYFDRIKTGWETMVNGIKWVWDNVLKPVWDAVAGFVTDTIAPGIERGVEMIDSAWRTVANLFREPINWVINFVWNDGIKKAFDNVASAIGSDARLPRAPTIPAFARGGLARPGWALVGEEGPELVNFTAPGRVYTAAQTRAMLGQANPLGFSASNPPHGGPGQWLRDRWDDVGNVGRAIGGVVRDAAGNVLSWVRGGLAKVADALLSPIFNTVAGTVGQWGGMGRLGGDVMVSAKDRMMDWIRGHDEAAAPDAGGRSIHGALPHVNNAAWAVADALGGIRRMDAFNQSMHWTHRAGRAIDFIDSSSVLQRIANFLVSNHSALNGVQEVIYNWHRWTPAAGWHRLTGGYGNDPGHTWHVHATWPASFDDGGWLMPGQVGMNYSRSPEPVFSASQWDVLKGNLQSGGGLSDRDVLRIAEAVRAGAHDGIVGRERVQRVAGVRANRLGGF